MESRETLKQQILERALKDVASEGWSTPLLNKAAEEITGDPSYGWRLFPEGPREAIAYWSRWCDQEMLKALPPPQELRVRERVSLAVKTRLLLLTPHREAAKKTLAYLKCPAHLGDATRLLYKTCDEIWYYAGDTSTDYNFYTKRALLGWVYTRTFLYWLKDPSENFERTGVFLDQRIAEVLALPKYFNFPWKWGKKN